MVLLVVCQQQSAWLRRPEGQLEQSFAAVSLAGRGLCVLVATWRISCRASKRAAGLLK